MRFVSVSEVILLSNILNDHVHVDKLTSVSFSYICRRKNDKSLHPNTPMERYEESLLGLRHANDDTTHLYRL